MFVHDQFLVRSLAIDTSPAKFISIHAAAVARVVPFDPDTFAAATHDQPGCSFADLGDSYHATRSTDFAVHAPTMRNQDAEAIPYDHNQFAPFKVVEFSEISFLAHTIFGDFAPFRF